MKLSVPVSSPDDIDVMASSGADEVYLGYFPHFWLERYGMTVPLNRRESFLSPASVFSYTDMRLIARACAQRGLPAAVTFNSPFYPANCLGDVLRAMERAMRAGFDRFIVSDARLMRLARREMPPFRLFVSGEACLADENDLRCLADVRPDRIIFQRSLSAGRMARMAREMPGIEYEAFFLNERCRYMGGLCAGLHGDALPPVCRLSHDIGGRDEALEPVLPPERDDSGAGGTGCGFCALPFLEEAGVTHLKIVGRGRERDQLARDVREARRALDTGELFSGGCPGSCYYPEYARFLPPGR